MALDFVAGTIGGCAGIVVGHPFDLIKVRLQTQSEAMPCISGRVQQLQFTGPLDCLKKTLQKEGMSGLFKGLGPPVMGNVPIQAICFGTYGAARRMLHSGEGNLTTQPLYEIGLAGAIAGTANCLVATPSELIKIKLQMQQEKTPDKGTTGGTACSGKGREPLYRGSVDCGRHIYEVGGLRALYRGFLPTVMRDSAAFAVYFAAYEGLCRAMTSPGEETSGLSPVRTMIAGSLCGAASWIVTYPVDLVKSKIQAQPIVPTSSPTLGGVPQAVASPAGGHPMGLLKCGWVTYKQGGFAPFFKGFAPTVLRAMPVGAVTFLGFEAVMSLAGQP